MKTSTLQVTIFALMALFLSAVAHAHGSMKPLHGGVVKIEHDMVFELVRGKKDTHLYLRDHGNPYSTENITGNITLLVSGNKSNNALSPVGGNKMTADVIIPDGAKILVKIKEPNHHAVVVRYVF